MNPTAKRCIVWSSALILIGAALITFGPNVVSAIYPDLWNKPGGIVLLGATSLFIGIVQGASMAVAGGLIGAAVVINTLQSRGREQAVFEDAPASDGEQG